MISHFSARVIATYSRRRRSSSCLAKTASRSVTIDAGVAALIVFQITQSGAGRISPLKSFFRVIVSGRITMGASSPLAPWTVITLILSPWLSIWRLTSRSSVCIHVRNPVRLGTPVCS